MAINGPNFTRWVCTGTSGRVYLSLHTDAAATAGAELTPATAPGYARAQLVQGPWPYNDERVLTPFQHVGDGRLGSIDAETTGWHTFRNTSQSPWPVVQGVGMWNAPTGGLLLSSETLSESWVLPPMVSANPAGTTRLEMNVAPRGFWIRGSQESSAVSWLLNRFLPNNDVQDYSNPSGINRYRWFYRNAPGASQYGPVGVGYGIWFYSLFNSQVFYNPSFIARDGITLELLADGALANDRDIRVYRYRPRSFDSSQIHFWQLFPSWWVLGGINPPSPGDVQPLFDPNVVFANVFQERTDPTDGFTQGNVGLRYDGGGRVGIPTSTFFSGTMDPANPVLDETTSFPITQQAVIPAGALRTGFI